MHIVRAHTDAGTFLCRIEDDVVVFGVAEIISYLARVMTLEPGDVVEVEVDRLGTLRNRVVVEASRG